MDIPEDVFQQMQTDAADGIRDSALCEELVAAAVKEERQKWIDWLTLPTGNNMVDQMSVGLLAGFLANEQMLADD